jgi:hypothetical protein
MFKLAKLGSSLSLAAALMLSAVALVVPAETIEAIFVPLNKRASVDR